MRQLSVRLLPLSIALVLLIVFHKFPSNKPESASEEATSTRCVPVVSEPEHSRLLQQPFVLKEEQFLVRSIAEKLLPEGSDSMVLEKRRISRGVVEFSLSQLSSPHSNRLIQEAKCKRCVVVGSGACLREKQLGALIDSYDVVIRVNKAPIRGYEALVGTRTDMRVLYPESAPSSRDAFQGEAIVVVVPYKTDNLLWAASIANSSLQLNLTGLLKPSPRVLPVEPQNVFLLNPQIPQYFFEAFKPPGARVKGARATTGFLAIQLALNLCGEVSVAGFCYNATEGDSLVYYYGDYKTKDNMATGPHRHSLENELREALFSCELLHDITAHL